MLCPAHSCFLISIDITYLSLRRSDQYLLVPPPSIMFPATLTGRRKIRDKPLLVRPTPMLTTASEEAVDQAFQPRVGTHLLQALCVKPS
mmetsp:Transcript_20499/g.40912  ORF Transcript_20499/g.40912 Transcript_20499/m.40912 type:complete len:89 (+) Transcript_20499:438-704(+)